MRKVGIQKVKLSGSHVGKKPDRMQTCQNITKLRKFCRFRKMIELLQQNASVAIVAVFFSGYFAYYTFFVAKKPKLACKDTKFRSFLLTHCPVISEKYFPTVWCFESRAQTILRSFLKSAPKLSYEGELIKMEDGGQVLLDWYQNDNEVYPDVETRPTVILLPGLT
ncbi:phospholipase ABHD3-like, partial [Mizuhopecten yessoensis]|uniref:phospholipase ABHD3-like n=1 Tax=Mizuhopecten yessoensis TaxID=6573 RepID=UPI000B458348